MINKKKVTHVKATVLLLLILLYLVQVIAHAGFLSLPLSILSVIAIGLSLPQSSRLGRVLSVLFLVFGTLMLIDHQATPLGYISSFGEMLNLLSLFAIIPLLALPIRLGGYPAVIERIIRQKVHSPSQLYRTISGLSFFLSSFMNLATLPMMYYNVRKSVEAFGVKESTRFTSLSIIHGYALPILWTPIAPIVGVVMDLTKVSWIAMLPSLITLSLFGLLLDWGMFQVKMRLHKQDGWKEAISYGHEVSASLETGGTGEAERDGRKMLHIILFIFLYISLIVLLDHLFTFGLVVSVVLLTLPMAAAWSALIGRGKAFAASALEHFTRNIPGMGEQFAIFLSAGFFVKAMQLSGYNVVLNEAVVGLGEWIGLHAFLLVLLLIPLCLAYLGMHPAVAITLLAQSLDPAKLGVSPEGLAITLLGGAVATFMMGPFNATLTIFSAIVKENPFTLSAWNWPFTTGFLMLVFGVLLVWV